LTPAAGGGWAEKILHDFNFNGIDGTYPWASLVIDTSGHLYGTTVEGGAYGVGTVFELKPTAGGGWAETVLHSFNTDGSDGYNPYCALVLDGSGNLYGTTSKGGAYDFGTVFEMKIRASGSGWNETILHSFDNITDGSSPQVGLIFDHVGSLYGTTYGGGSFYGTAFELIPGAGGNWTEKILHEFSSTNPDGHSPYGNLIFDAAGNLYGTTSGGGAYNYGTVFEVKP